MKKLIALLLAVTAIFACVSCSDGAETENAGTPVVSASAESDPGEADLNGSESDETSSGKIESGNAEAPSVESGQADAPEKDADEKDESGEKEDSGKKKSDRIWAAEEAAEKIGKAAQKAADTLDENDECIIGSCIISSDKSKTIMKCNTTEERYMEVFDQFVDDRDKFDYFVYIHQGYVVYAVAKKRGSVGTYPVDSLVTGVGSNKSYEEINESKAKFDDLYKKCVQVLEKN